MLLTADDFVRMFGGPLGLTAVQQIAQFDWNYEPIIGEPRDLLVLDLLRRLDDNRLTSPDRDVDRWERGWKQNLQSLKNQKPDALVPGYLSKEPAVRLFGDFVLPVKSSEFEANWYGIYRDWLFTTWLTGYDSIFEFGCGSGHNLPFLRERAARVVGLDWAPSSVKIAEHLGFEGRLLDFFAPDYKLDVPPRTAFLTMGAMEQTGTRWPAMLEFILATHPAIVVHSEPILDLYDATLPDWLAARIHTQRGFWTGYLEELRGLEVMGRVKIERLHRTGFGSLLLEGYSQLIWRPL